MAASDYPQKPHFTVPQHSSKSCSNVLCKSLIVILVLVIIPLFPSQAPDFISQSIFTQFWELLHLMFIGIAVCYGIFSRRSVKNDTETVVHDSRFDTSHAYLSGISNVSSIFEDGVENFCGSDEKRKILNWDSRFLQYECRGTERSEQDEAEKIASFSRKSGAKNMLNEMEVAQVWNSQYTFGEPMVVVANESHGIEHLAHFDHKSLGLPIRSLRPESANECTGNSGDSSDGVEYVVRRENIRGMAPMNLGRKFEEAAGACQIPWRSRSQRREVSRVPPSHSRHRSVGHIASRSYQKPVSSRTSPTCSSSRCTSPSSSASSETGSVTMPNFEQHNDLGGIPIGEETFMTSKVEQSSNESLSEMNVQLKYDYADGFNEIQGRELCQAQHDSHSSPQYVGETELGHLESWAFWNPIPSQTISESSTPGAISAISSTSPEVENFKRHDLEIQKDLKSPFVSLTQPTARSANGAAPGVNSKTRRLSGGSSSAFDMHKLNDVASVNSDSTFHSSKTQAISIGSSSEINMQDSAKDELSCNNLKEDFTYRQQQSAKSIGLDVKPPIPSKSLSRGKSVRTFGARKHFIGGSKTKKDCASRSGYINGVSRDQFDTVSLKGEGHANVPVIPRKSVLDNIGPKPSSASSESQSAEKQEFVNMLTEETKVNSESVLTNSQTSPDDEEEAGSNFVDDADLGSEVDRKADEFIAKFREQIRLQKIESFRKSSGL